jgi:hypothetical protein
MPQTTIGRGNELYDWVINPTVTWSGSVGATSTAELTCTIAGLVVGDYIDSLVYPSGPMTTGLTYSNCRVSVANTLAVTWINTTAGALTPPVGPYYVNVLRVESVANLPATAI